MRKTKKTRRNELNRLKGLTDDDIKTINSKWDKFMEYTRNCGFTEEAGFGYKDKTLKQKQRLIKTYETNGTRISSRSLLQYRTRGREVCTKQNYTNRLSYRTVPTHVLSCPRYYKSYGSNRS